MKKTAAVLALVVVVVGTVAGQDSDPVAKKAKTIQERMDARIKKLEDSTGKLEVELTRLKKGTINSKAKEFYRPLAGFELAKALNSPTYDPTKAAVFKTKDAREAAVKSIEQQLEMERGHLEKAKARPDYGHLSYPPKIGDFGMIYPGEQKVNVRQVINPTTMLIRVFYTVESYKAVGNQAVKDFQTQEVTLMVKNFPNKGATDGAGFDLPQPFEVTDTTTYKTAIGGSNTVFVIEPLDTKKIEAHMKKQKQ